MSLAEKQQLFVDLVARLLSFAVKYAESHGLHVSLDEAFRPPELAALYAKQGRGIAHSLHIRRLALDLNVMDGASFANGSHYKALGDYWKSLDPLARWGGDFSGSVDLRHFSLTDGGIA